MQASRRHIVAPRLSAPPWLYGFVRTGTNPVPELLPSLAWEAGNSMEDLKFIDKDTTRYGFYAAAEAVGQLYRNIGYVSTPITSYPTGLTKHATPVIARNTQACDTVLVSAPVPVMFSADLYRVYYHAYDGSTEVTCCASATAAQFPDTLTKYASNPVLPVGTGWEAASVRGEIIVPSRLAPDGKDHMIYAGNSAVTDAGFQGGHATSTDDGLTWTKDPANPVLPLGPLLSWYRTGFHPVGGWIKANGIFYFFFQGFEGAAWRIGVFETADFATFTVWPSPVYSLGVEGAWDSETVENPGVIWNEEDGTVDLWPTCNDNYGTMTYKFGFARATGQIPP